MSKPFFKLGTITTNREFPDIIDIMKEKLGAMDNFTAGGVHRWNPNAMTFEFHNDKLASIVLESNWENVYMMPLLKVGMHEADGKIHVAIRNPNFFMKTTGGGDFTNVQRMQIHSIVNSFKEKVTALILGAQDDIGKFSLLFEPDGFELNDKKINTMLRRPRTRDIFKSRIAGDPAATVKEVAGWVTAAFDELEGWRIIDQRDYGFVRSVDQLIFIEFCTPQYAGQAMRMDGRYNLILPCLGSVRAENGNVFINMFLPEFMFKPLFYAVSPEIRKQNNDFPQIVTKIIRDTCLKYTR